MRSKNGGRGGEIVGTLPTTITLLFFLLPFKILFLFRGCAILVWFRGVVRWQLGGI